MPPSTKRDYYEILGIKKDATGQGIKRAYRNLALKHHPDRVPDDQKQQAEEAFKDISEAYAVLSDEQKRAQYDRFGVEGIHSRYSREDIFRNADFGDFSSVLDQMFGGGLGDIFGGGGRQRGPRRGADLQYAIEITLAEAYKGLTKSVRIPRLESCEQCQGSKAEPGTSPIVCQSCGGKGQVQANAGFMVIARPCSSCGGAGSRIEQPCRACHGQGRVQRERTLDVKIPAGVDTGTHLRLTGEGEAGDPGAGRGDLYVGLQIAAHDIFSREQEHLYIAVPMNMVDAALGTEISVPTMSGQVSMKVPAGTQGGKVFRLRGKGMPILRGGGHGDQFVRILVETPTNLSSKQRALFEELRGLKAASGPLERSFLDRLKRAFKAH